MLALLLLLACGEKADDSATDSEVTHDDSDSDSDSGGDSAPVDEDGDGFTEAEDCDDSDPGVFPGAEESCDGVDQDCDEAVDEGAADGSEWFEDDDGDGYGEGDPVIACEAPEGHAAASGDCDDRDAGTHPDAAETCDGEDNDCDDVVDEDPSDPAFWYRDQDEDGYGDDEDHITACEGPEGYVEDAGDCDDTDPAFHPGASERDCADPSDYNCDGSTGYADDDGDGYAACEECDDGDAAVNPGAAEVCNGIDDDCDSRTDDDDSSLDTSTASSFYDDLDGDGFGDPGGLRLACDPPSGTVTDSTDCDDADSSAYPGADETCDDVDDDCDGTVDEAATDAPTWYADADGDGYGDVNLSRDACDPPSSYVADDTDCDDANAAVNPAAAEVCNGVDDDCDGDTDPDTSDDVATWYADADADGYGDAATTDVDCEQPSGFVDDDTDCDDTDAAVNPAAVEVCNGVDDDCDGDVDPDSSADVSTWYADADADGYGDVDSADLDCDQPSGFVADDTDCDDTDAAINPGAAELWYDGVDADCDGLSDYDADADGYDSEDYGGEDCDDGDASRFPGATSWTVPGDFSTIQAALDAACSLETISVSAGTYSEALDFNGRAVSLVGVAGSGATTIDAGLAGPVITLSGGEVEGFTLTGGSASFGGGVYALGGDLRLSELVIEDCLAVNDGGGVYLEDVGVVALEDVVIQANGAGDDGGGLAALMTNGASDATTLSLTRVEVLDNFTGASGYGGGLYLEDNSGALDMVVTATDLDVVGNTSESRGGGLYLDAAPLSWTGGLLSENEAGGTGGGAYTTNADLSLDEVDVIGNTGDSAGGFYVSSGALTLTNLGVEENTSNGSYGGGYCRGSDCVLSGVDLIGNFAEGSYPALLVAGSAPTYDLDAVRVLRNLSSNDAAAISLEGSGDADNLEVAGNAAAGLAVEPGNVAYTALIRNVTVAGNTGSGLLLVPNWANQVQLINVVSVHNEGWGAEVTVTDHRYDPLLSYGNLYGNLAGDITGMTDPTGADGNISDRPIFAFFDADLPAIRWALHLGGGSPMLDAGDPSLLDPDGSVSDMGAWGGPSVDFSWYDDGDGDGLPDGWETWAGLDTSADDRSDDPDGDGLTNASEHQLSTHPTLADSDRDGRRDNEESSSGDALTPDLPDDATLLGVSANDRAGVTLLNAGDSDGDGTEEWLIGALNSDVAWLVPAGSDGDLDSVALSRFEGDTFGEAGAVLDYNGDGTPDIALSKTSGTDTIYLFYGPTSGALTLSDADESFTREALNDRSGRQLANLGDSDGDGVDDLLIAAPLQDGGGTSSGGIYVLSGGTSSGVLSVASGYRSGVSANDQAGEAAAAAGDVNGDGLGDAIVGTSREDSAFTNAGAAYLLLGPITGTGSLSSADAEWRGAEIAEGAGEAVSGAGDVNADGYDDLLIGAPDARDAQGVAYVVFGPTSGTHSLDEADAALWGERTASAAGAAVAGLGDVSGDGVDDLGVGGPMHASERGAAWVFYGPVTGAQSLGDADLRWLGEAEGDRLGEDLSGIGDADGDGVDDLLIGIPYSSSAASEAGELRLYLGG
ncbi:MAG: FG-GAP repeat protein [Alphaproteobacteria bacterium]|nr:FG-GAP repeat protein [Alphaproteobacteria bacterium]